MGILARMRMQQGKECRSDITAERGRSSVEFRGTESYNMVGVQHQVGSKEINATSVAKTGLDHLGM